MEESRPEGESKRRLTPAERLDKEITSRGWGALVLVFLLERGIGLAESTLALLVALILLSVNSARLVKGFRLQYFSLALGLITLVHGVTHFLEIPFPFWPLTGGAALLYGVAKLLLKERIR